MFNLLPYMLLGHSLPFPKCFKHITLVLKKERPTYLKKSSMMVNIKLTPLLEGTFDDPQKLVYIVNSCLKVVDTYRELDMALLSKDKMLAKF